MTRLVNQHALKENIMWNWNSNCTRAYAETSDPRLLIIIERDEDSAASAPDGDAYAPTYWLDDLTRGTVNQAGSTYSDDDTAEALARAAQEWGIHDDTTARYMRIFHGVQYKTEQNVVILDTPGYRTHVGTPDNHPHDDFLRGDIETWRAYQDGDVFGIGYAVNEARTTTETPVPSCDDLEGDGWEVEIECWGYYGEDWVKAEAYGLPFAPQLPGFVY